MINRNMVTKCQNCNFFLIFSAMLEKSSALDWRVVSVKYFISSLIFIVTCDFTASDASPHLCIYPVGRYSKGYEYCVQIPSVHALINRVSNWKEKWTLVTQTKLYTVLFYLYQHIYCNHDIVTARKKHKCPGIIQFDSVHFLCNHLYRYGNKQI